MIAVHPLPAIGEVAAGDDLARLLAAAMAAAGLAPEPGDVLVVTQKIVSKAEDRFVALDAVAVSEEAAALAETTRKDPRLVALVLAESAAVVRTAPNVLITRTGGGLVMANAGIDRSNLGPGADDRALLLPRDADASAALLKQDLDALLGAPIAIVVSDSFGRPWRMGVVNVAIGAAGLPALVDRRGEPDRDGRALEVTQVALADMVATAAGLATGEGAEGVPAALVRGLHWSAPSTPAAALVRPIEQDLFR